MQLHAVIAVCVCLFLLSVFPAGAGASAPAFGERSSPVPPGTLAEVIEALYAQPVLVYGGQAKESLACVARTALTRLQEEGVQAGRVNEAGNAVESIVIEALLAHGFEAAIPAAVSGRRRSSGYPDIEARLGEHFFYIEVKTYHPSQEHSSYRSFYLSPSSDPKVQRAAFHLLIAFALEPEAEGRYRATSVRWLDISRLSLRLKQEYNASNRELYGLSLEWFQADAPESGLSGETSDNKPSPD